MVSSFHPTTSLCSPVCSAWLSVYWWHQNHRRTCCVSLFKTVSSLYECKTVLCRVFIPPSQSRVCGSSVIFSLCRPNLDSGMTNTINLSPFTSGNSLLLTWHISGSLYMLWNPSASIFSFQRCLRLLTLLILHFPSLASMWVHAMDVLSPRNPCPRQ